MAPDASTQADSVGYRDYLAARIGAETATPEREDQDTTEVATAADAQEASA